MVKIVTGTNGSGKTTYLREVYETNRTGDGVLSLRHFSGETLTGYDMLHLQSGNRYPLIRLKDRLPAGWDEHGETGSYSFSREGFRIAEDILRGIRTAPVYIDEIGPLEILQKKGFFQLLQEFSARGTALFLSVRESLLDDMIRMFFYDKEIEIITR